MRLINQSTVEDLIIEQKTREQEDEMMYEEGGRYIGGIFLRVSRISQRSLVDALRGLIRDTFRLISIIRAIKKKQKRKNEKIR